jgi:hypothetical protein
LHNGGRHRAIFERNVATEIRNEQGERQKLQHEDFFLQFERVSRLAARALVAQPCSAASIRRVPALNEPDSVPRARAKFVSERGVGPLVSSVHRLRIDGAFAVFAPTLQAARWS